MHSVFRIGQIELIPNNDRLWQVELTLTNDNDPQLQDLTKCIQEETEGVAGWFRVAMLMMKMAHHDKAQRKFEIILDQTTDEIEKEKIYNCLGVIMYDQGKYTEALSFYEKDLEIFQKTVPTDHPDLATSYNNSAWMYRRMGDYLKALSFYEKDPEICQKALPADHPTIKNAIQTIESVKKKL
jgi:tetratricopeptide (TPR) repeat protein